ncbi:hypothetical protein PR048_031092 [Dryococelus australis]|uniref:Uncharacterized protein n=1 Tax=Dryococelus australis TaxID=614101 RepID=A0ABQ9G4A1_9NEOP|nr:hypothetical protein PR048_031092 [Dryococelus australis]
MKQRVGVECVAIVGVSLRRRRRRRKQVYFPGGGRGGIVVRLLASHQGGPGSIPGGAAAGPPHVGIVTDDASACRWAFSGFSCCIHSCIPAPLHTHLASPSSALKASVICVTTLAVCCVAGGTWRRPEVASVPAGNRASASAFCSGGCGLLQFDPSPPQPRGCIRPALYQTPRGQIQLTGSSRTAAWKPVHPPDRAYQKQSSDTHKTPYDRVLLCRERSELTAIIGAFPPTSPPPSWGDVEGGRQGAGSVDVCPETPRLPDVRDIPYIHCHDPPSDDPHFTRLLASKNAHFTVELLVQEPEGLFPASEAEKRGSYKGYTGTRYMCAIAPACRALPCVPFNDLSCNRAVHFSSQHIRRVPAIVTTVSGRLYGFPEFQK